MPRGGKREGAGRKAGSATAKTREVANAAAVAGLTPLDYMLTVLRNEAALPAERMWAAEKAAPYIHPKLSSAEVKHAGEIGLRISKEQRDASLAAALRADT